MRRQAAGRGIAWTPEAGAASLARLVDPHESALMVVLSRFPEVVESAGATLEPHLVATYLREVAAALHAYYHACPFLVDDGPLRDARLALAVATQYVLASGLDLLGVSAPESM